MTVHVHALEMSGDLSYSCCFEMCPHWLKIVECDILEGWNRHRALPRVASSCFLQRHWTTMAPATTATSQDDYFTQSGLPKNGKALTEFLEMGIAKQRMAKRSRKAEEAGLSEAESATLEAKSTKTVESEPENTAKDKAKRGEKRKANTAELDDDTDDNTDDEGVESGPDDGKDVKVKLRSRGSRSGTGSSKRNKYYAELPNAPPHVQAEDARINALPPRSVPGKKIQKQKMMAEFHKNENWETPYLNNLKKLETIHEHEFEFEWMSWKGVCDLRGEAVAKIQFNDKERLDRRPTTLIDVAQLEKDGVIISDYDKYHSVSWQRLLEQSGLYAP